MIDDSYIEFYAKLYQAVFVRSLTSVNKFLYCTFSPGDSCSQALIKVSIDSSSLSG